MFGSAVSSGVSLLPSSGRLDAGLRTGIYPEAGRDSNRCTGTHAAAGPDDAPCTSGRGDGTGAAAWSSRASSRGSQRLGRAKRLPWAHLAAREQAAAARLAEAAEARAQLLTYLPDVERDVALNFEIYSDGSFFSADGAGSSRLSCAPAGADLYEPSLYGDDYNLYAGRQEAWLRRYDSGRGRLRGLDVNDDEGFQEFNSCDGDVLDLERGGQTAGGSERGGSEGDVFSSDTESLYEWLTHISDALLEAEEELSSGRWFGRGSRGGVGVPARPLPPAPWAPAEREEVVQEAVALATQRCLLKAAVLPLDRLIKEYGADVDRWAKEAGDQAVIAGGETEQEQKRLLLRAKQQRREAAELFKSSMRTRLQLTRSCNAKTAAYEMLLEGPRGEQIGIDADITDFRLAVQRLEVICELLQRKTGKGSGGSGGSSETVARFEELCAVLMAAVTDEDGPERLRWRVLMDAATRATGAAKHTAIVALNWALLGCVQIIAGCLIADGSPLHELGPLDPVTAAAAAACYEYASLSASEAGVAEQVYYSAEQFYAMLHMGPLPPIALQVRTDLLPATAASPPQPQPLPQPLSAEHLNSTAMRSMFHTLSTYGWLGYLHLVGRDGDNNAVSEEELIAAEDELFGCELVDYVLWQQQSQQSQLISTGDADTVSGSGDEGECAASPQPQQGLPRSAVAGPGPGPAAGPSTATRRSAAAAAAPPAGAATAVSAVSSSSGGGGGSREPRQGLLEVAAAWDALPPPPAALQAQAVALLAATREVLALMEQPMRVLPAEVGATTAGKGPGWSLGPPPEAPAGAAGDGESEVRCRLRLEGPELVAALAMLLADGQALADYRKGSGAGQLQTLWLPVGNPPASASAVSGATSTGAQRAGQQHGPQQQQLQHGIEVEFVRCLGFSARETLGGGSTTLMEERKLRLSNNIVQVTDKLKPADAAKQAHKVLKEYGACYMHGKGAGGVLRVLQALARVRQDMRQAGGGGRDVAALVTETVHYGDADVLNECRKATTPAPAAAGQHAGTGASQQQQKQKHQPAYAGQEGEAAEPLDDWSLQACVDEFAVNVEILERGPVGSCGSDADLELELQLGRLVERLAWRVLLPLLPPPPPQQGQRGSGGGGGGDGGGSNTPVACEAGSSDVVLWLEQVYQLIGGAKHREGRDEARWLIDHAVGSARKELVVEFLVLTCSPGHPTEFYLAPGVAAAAQKKLKEEKMTKDVAVIDRL